MNSYGKKSLITASLILPITLVATNIVEWYLKTNNPDNVDITAGLAYLRPILVTGFSTFIILALVALALGIFGLKKDTSPQSSKLALTILAAVVLLSVTSAITASKSGSAEDAYRKDHASTTNK